MVRHTSKLQVIKKRSRCGFRKQINNRVQNAKIAGELCVCSFKIKVGSVKIVWQQQSDG